MDYLNKVYLPIQDYIHKAGKTKKRAAIDKTEEPFSTVQTLTLHKSNGNR